MAERRMFSKTIIDSDAFLDMPLSAQALYFHLSMRADDEGFVGNPKRIKGMIGASEDDLKLLIVKRFLLVFESGVVVIKHWKIHNYIQSDRAKPTTYIEERNTLSLDEKKSYIELLDTKCIQNGYNLDTQDSIGKDSIGKDNIYLPRVCTHDEQTAPKKERPKFIPPTLKEVQEYAKSRNRSDLAQKFYDYFTEGNWKDSEGKQVRAWKQKFITWETHNTVRQSEQVTGFTRNASERFTVDDLEDFDDIEV